LRLSLFVASGSHDWRQSRSGSGASSLNQYLGANVPQAWAAGTPFMLLQAMLGLQQDAPRGKLYVDPALPDWLPDVTLMDLRLGRRRFDIRFWRDGKDTDFKVLKGKPDAVQRMSMALSGSMADR
jgi:hypothetical protein